MIVINKEIINEMNIYGKYKEVIPNGFQSAVIICDYYKIKLNPRLRGDDKRLGNVTPA